MTKTLIAVLGIDLGKNSCSLAGLDASGAVIMRRRMTREGVTDGHFDQRSERLRKKPRGIVPPEGQARRIGRYGDERTDSAKTLGI